MTFAEYLRSRTVPAPGKGIARTSALAAVPAVAAIYAMAVPFALLDACTCAYHAAYFGTFGLPKVDRRKHVVIDRGRLRGLNWGQRVNCMYCDYANGVLSWVSAVTRVTEIYSCAIRHPSGIRHHDEPGYYDTADAAAGQAPRA